MNPSLIKLCLGGGLFSLLCLNHLIVDFVFQTHFEAMNKHNNAKIRAIHCFVYTIGFLPILFTLHSFNAINWLEFTISINLLFWSHFGQDTYASVVLWARYIRRIPEMQPPNDMKKGFIEFVNTTLGKILLISIDQIIHFTCLLPIVYMALN